MQLLTACLFTPSVQRSVKMGLPQIDRSIPYKPVFGFRFSKFGSRKAKEDTDSTYKGSWRRMKDVKKL
jgi:hypothetical protein